MTRFANVALCHRTVAQLPMYRGAIYVDEITGCGLLWMRTLDRSPPNTQPITCLSCLAQER